MNIFTLQAEINERQKTIAKLVSERFGLSKQINKEFDEIDKLKIAIEKIRKGQNNET